MKKILLLFLCSSLFIQLSSQVMHTSLVAGSGSAGTTDGSSSMATFHRPVGITVDKFGQLFIADFYGHTIRKIDNAGNVTTIAGTGTAGFRDGPGLIAQFNRPGGICVDKLGNLYVTDNLNQRIRKIDSNGVVSTVAGTGGAGFQNGAGSLATFRVPRAIAVDANNFLYVADRDNHAIRLIDTNNVVSTLVGTGTGGYLNGIATVAQLNKPGSVEVDPSGVVYFTDNNNRRVRKVDLNGIVSTVAGNGLSGTTDSTLLLSSFETPVGMALKGDSVIYINDLTAHNIRKIDLINNRVSTFAGSGTAGYLEARADAAMMGDVFELVFDDFADVLYFTDGTNNRVRKVADSNLYFFSDTVCDGIPSFSGNQTWTSSGRYRDTVPFAPNIMKVVSLLVKHSTDTAFNATACGSYTSPSGKIWSAAGTYYDTIRNVVGCDSFLTVSLVTNPATSDSITVEACNSYTSPSGLANWTSSGIYHDTIPNSIGCDSLITVNLTVNTIDNSITRNGRNLSANAVFANYQWLDCTQFMDPIPGATNQTFNAVNDGAYAVEVSRPQCKDTSICEIIFTIGLNEIEANKLGTISPNPGNGLFEIQLNPQYANTIIRVSQANGQLIFEKELNNAQFNILDLTNYAHGIYLITLQNEEKIQHLKLIKQ